MPTVSKMSGYAVTQLFSEPAVGIACSCCSSEKMVPPCWLCVCTHVRLWRLCFCYSRSYAVSYHLQISAWKITIVTKMVIALEECVSVILGGGETCVSFVVWGKLIIKSINTFGIMLYSKILFNRLLPRVVGRSRSF